MLYLKDNDKKKIVILNVAKRNEGSLIIR